MADDKRKEVKLKHEMRTEDISQMIEEGGLGADKYYDIKKPKYENENDVDKTKKDNKKEK